MGYGRSAQPLRDFLSPKDGKITGSFEAMDHCPYAKLEDLKDILFQVRKLPNIKEPKPGIFYIKGKSFLHFHLKDDRRWADVRDGKDWGPSIDVPFGIN